MNVGRYEDNDRPELDAERALTALRWCWSEVYQIWIDQDTGLWLARRLDGLGIIEGNGPDGLRIEILEDCAWASTSAAACPSARSPYAATWGSASLPITSPGWGTAARSTATR